MKPTKQQWLRWGKHLFVTLHFLLITVILLSSITMYIAFRPDGLELLRTYLLKPLGVHYRSSDGSLIDGFTLHDLRSKKMEAKTLTLTYSLSKMLEGKHIVDSLRVDGLRLHLDDFLNADKTPWPFPTFALKKVVITNLQLISVYPIEIDLEGKNGSYDGEFLSFASIRATVQSRYASAAVEGEVNNNAIKGFALLYPNAAELALNVGKFTDLPRTLSVRIDELSAKEAKLSTNIASLILKQEPLTRAEKIKLRFDYRYDNGYFDTDADYTLRRGSDSMQTRQQLRYTVEGRKTATRFDGTLTSSHPLPSHNLHGELNDDADGLSGHLSVDKGNLHFSSDDYDRYRWDIDASSKNLSFLPMLPSALQTSPVKIKAHGDYFHSRSLWEGSGRLEHNHGTFEGKFVVQNTRRSLEGNLTLSPDAPTWKNWSYKPPEHLALTLIQKKGQNTLHLSGDAFELFVQGDTYGLQGSGNYLGNYFDLKAAMGNAKQELWIDAVTPSLFAAVSKFKPIELHPNEYYDAEVRSTTHITLTNTLHIHSDITVPWYAAVLDSQRAFGGTDGHMSVNYNDGNITVDHYRFEIANHFIHTDKPSKFHLGRAGELIIDEVWVYDTLLLTGTIFPEDLRASLRLQSDRFSYKGPEGDAHMAANLSFERDVNGSQSLTGQINILDATITYLPLQQFKVMDDDIIIIQDVRPPGTTKLSMNIHIGSRQPIRYLTKELDISFIPDITLWKESLGPVEILGMVSIPEGKAKTGGKLFTIKPSEIYFGGNIPINPYLNLTIEHEVDYKKIFIYVTHTLESPIFLFSSDPVMSQNDIMSYILFGGPANTALGDNSTGTVRADATNFMLGAGLKGLINGATKIQIDTMNILSTPGGGMGFEVGARLNKDLRILYKNDTVSSVLLQYTINKWLRLDADVHELGQGIKAVYVKDFRDIFPHNEVKKK
ncbi:translocation/assembly module TamB domain-containing protein [Sulfuricurvum sp.]|uniref:translocation/assembly module TamB domain-containing protein n=1 Tax=Sulfuricurvum sp. TaxID=2025608 RepID=UPI003564F97C